MSAPTFSHGFAAGLVAFAAGLPAVPVADPATGGALAGVPVGGGAEYLRGWLSGWHSANLVGGAR